MLRKTIERIRKINRMWLLLLVPIGLLASAVALPLLLIAMMIGTRFLSVFIGPINIWNTPNHAPPLADVAGIYTPDDASREDWTREHVTISPLSYIRLNEDHTVEIHDMPTFDDFGQPQNCQLSAIGKWGLDKTGGEVQVNVYLTQSSPRLNDKRCASEGGHFIELLGRHQPYRLYQIIGDPDSGAGITYLHR